MRSSAWSERRVRRASALDLEVTQDDDIKSDIDGTMSYHPENLTEYPRAPHVADCFGR